MKKKILKAIKEKPMKRSEIMNLFPNHRWEASTFISSLLINGEISVDNDLFSIAAKKPKYNNKKVEYDGFKFDSIAESNRYMDLMVQQKAGIISELGVHPKFDLLPSVKWNGKTHRKRTYTADFQYKEGINDVVEDVKSLPTSKKDTYTLKRHMFLVKYPEFLFREYIY